jgi:gluconolactonase
MASGAVDGGASDGNVGPMKRFSCPGGPYLMPVAGQSQPICKAFTFKYNWNEGPTWITSEQAFFFTNFVQGAAGPGDIIKYTPGGQCETWVTGAGCNGLTAAFDGTLVGVCQTPRAVVAYDVVTKQPKVLASTYMGKMLDSPNDVVSHSNGSIYFTNPTYELGGRPVGLGPAILYIDPTGTLNLIAKTGGQPNGICLSADEKRLYVVGGGVWDLDAMGVPTKANVNFPLNADGISVDCAGNVYLSGGAIIDPSGKQIGTFPGGTMATFGGADGKTLIVVGGGTGVHTVQMNIPGPPH